MASFMQRIILITLILTIATPISIGHREKSENESDRGDDSQPESEIVHYLSDICSATNISKQCWKIIKPEITRFNDTDSRSVTRLIIDLAIAKSDDIKHKLKKLHRDSRDHALKDKYNSCSINYNQANHNLKIVKRNLHSHDYRKIHDRVNHIVKEVESCKHQFEKKSSDPAHIRDKNKEFGYYVEIVKTAANHFLREKDDDNA